jgi:hypothetical protein
VLISNWVYSIILANGTVSLNKPRIKYKNFVNITEHERMTAVDQNMCHPEYKMKTRLIQFIPVVRVGTSHSAKWTVPAAPVLNRQSYSTRQEKQHIFIFHARQGSGQPLLQALANQHS